MKGIISTNKIELEEIDKIINDGMKLKDSTYNATFYGLIYKHPVENKFVLIVNDDKRNPKQFLNSANKLKHIEINYAEWFPPHD